MNEQDARKVVEAVLFSASGVLSARELAGIVGNSSPAHIGELVSSLNTDYETSNRTFRIVAIGDGFQMRTLPMYKTWIAKVEPLKPVRLTPPALETLAIVAYRQPVTRAEIENLRGVDCSGALRRLLELRLVKILGKDKGPGRPILYGTGREFLSLFNLPDLRDLPTLEDFDLRPQELPAAAAAGGTGGDAG
jgi:segregation and condensation protein B